MPALLEALLERVPIPIEGARVEKYDKGVKLYIPVELLARKLKEELDRSLKERKAPFPAGIIDIRAEGDSLVFDVRVV